MAETARAADDLGFRALWTADHLLAPGSQLQFARVFEPLTCLRIRPRLSSRSANRARPEPGIGRDPAIQANVE
jgi:alkanesulfonate monooxygenase SsuD/methylene tetrahydromethanopterin reductase-like flavin-dependent oxidoreductase (luciferase family)